uniref:Homeobox domain-containing protein n=1 Tax=Astatotilapia calliptera TaxID=8154 RepID=A0A3P8QIJ5_ASTCA
LTKEEAQPPTFLPTPTNLLKSPGVLLLSLKSISLKFLSCLVWSSFSRDTYSSFPALITGILKMEDYGMHFSPGMYSGSNTVTSTMCVMEEKAKVLKGRTRGLFSDSQLKTLDHHFNQKIYPDPQEMTELSELTGLTYKQVSVKTWFQNRRRKFRKIPDSQHLNQGVPLHVKRVQIIRPTILMLWAMLSLDLNGPSTTNPRCLAGRCHQATDIMIATPVS